MLAKALPRLPLVPLTFHHPTQHTQTPSRHSCWHTREPRGHLESLETWESQLCIIDGLAGPRQGRGKKTEGSPLCAPVLDNHNPDNQRARSVPSGRWDEAKRREATRFSERKGRNVNCFPRAVHCKHRVSGAVWPCQGSSSQIISKKKGTGRGGKSREALGPRPVGFAQLFPTPLTHVHTQSSTHTHASASLAEGGAEGAWPDFQIQKVGGAEMSSSISCPQWYKGR